VILCCDADCVEILKRGDEFTSPLRPELLSPSTFDLGGALLDDLRELSTFARQTKDPCSSITSGGNSFEVAPRLQAGQQVVHGLFRHQRSPRELRRTHTVGSRGLEHREMRGRDVVIAPRSQVLGHLEADPDVKTAQEGHNPEGVH